jgi:hypothetical protein
MGTLRRGNKRNCSAQLLELSGSKRQWRVAFGGFMSNQQRQESTQSPHTNFEPAWGLTTASVAGRQQETVDKGQEKEWEAHLRNLQQLICELLIKNQQLRWLLESEQTTNARSLPINMAGTPR